MAFTKGERLKDAKSHLICKSRTPLSPLSHSLTTHSPTTAQARALYAPKYPNATFDVIIDKQYAAPKAADFNQPFVRVRPVIGTWASVIVYSAVTVKTEEPRTNGAGNWTLLLRSAKKGDTFAAMDDLMQMLYEALGKVMRM
jgi:hypothetical protein